MLDSHRKNFLGLSGFIWWMGVVENRMDPLNMGRLQVRIFGWNTENLQLLPSADLPWAAPVKPIDSWDKVPKEGDYIIGFYMDNESGQIPYYFGVFNGIPDAVPDQTHGFSDQRTQEQLNASPRRFGEDPKLYPNILNQPTTSRLYRNEDMDNTIIKRENDSRDTGITTAEGVTWDQPESSYATVSPYNRVLETESGHVMEFDDTFEHERIHLAHRTGTFEEIRPDGSKVTKVVGDNYELIAGTDYVYIKGTCNITVTGDATLQVGGKVVARAEEFDLTGPVNINGELSVTGGVSVSKGVSAGAGVSAGGSVSAGGNVSAAGTLAGSGLALG